MSEAGTRMQHNWYMGDSGIHNFRSYPLTPTNSTCRTTPYNESGAMHLAYVMAKIIVLVVALIKVVTQTKLDAGIGC